MNKTLSCLFGILLVCFSLASVSGASFGYDAEFHDLKIYMDEITAPLLNTYVVSLDYNGTCWLITDGNRIVKFDGNNISLIVPSDSIIRPNGNISPMDSKPAVVFPKIGIIKWDEYREAWIITTYAEDKSSVITEIWLLKNNELQLYTTINYSIDNVYDNGKYFLILCHNPVAKSWKTSAEKMYIIHNNKSIENIDKYMHLSNISTNDNFYEFCNAKWIPYKKYWILYSYTVNPIIVFNGTYGENIYPKLNMPYISPHKKGSYVKICDVGFNGSSYLITGFASVYGVNGYSYNYIATYDGNNTKIYKYNYTGTFNKIFWINNTWIIEFKNYSSRYTSIEYYNFYNNGSLNLINTTKPHIDFTPVALYLDTYPTDIRKNPNKDGEYLITLNSLNSYFTCCENYPNVGALISLHINQYDNNNISKKILYKGKGLTSMDYNGKYWLIGGNGILLYYDGKNTTDITKKAHLSNSVISSVAFGCNCWLIGSKSRPYYKSSNVSLVKFDGDKATDLTNTSNISSVEKIAYNGRYFLISGDNKLIKYNNGSFDTILDKSHSTNYYIIDEMDYNKNQNYWLVGGYCRYTHPAVSDAVLYKIYDNGTCEYLPMIDILPPSNFTYCDYCSITVIKYIPDEDCFIVRVSGIPNQDYWFMYKNDTFILLNDSDGGFKNNTALEHILRINPNIIEWNKKYVIFNCGFRNDQYNNKICIYNRVNYSLITCSMWDIPTEPMLVVTSIYICKNGNMYKTTLLEGLVVITILLIIFIAYILHKKY
jgi:hypothetical protein